MRNSKRQNCPNCLRAHPVCYCHTLFHIQNQWPVHIIQHPNETKHAIGTARIAQLSLLHCQTTVITNQQTEEQLTPLLPQASPLLIFPGKESVPIEEIDKRLIRPLIFLDGSWRKAQRMLYEMPTLDNLTKVSFSPPAPSRYRIRKEPSPEAVSTIEAIALVLGHLEDDVEKYHPLLKTMDWMVNKQIEYMGDAVYNKNYSNR